MTYYKFSMVRAILKLAGLEDLGKGNEKALTRGELKFAAIYIVCYILCYAAAAIGFKVAVDRKMRQRRKYESTQATTTE